MNLYKYDKRYFDIKASETGFIRDNIEKVYRLCDVLEYLNRNPIHSESLALKGGTAINLLIFDMPRLSVDIDLDFCLNLDREEMLEHRKRINADLFTYLQTQGYIFSPEKGKNPHSLDSWVFWYINSAGNKDNIKIEINYSMRSHILPIAEIPLKTTLLDRDFLVRSLSPVELFGSKINALIGRAAARDLYDVDNMIHQEIFSESEMPLLRKCILFYYAVGGSKEFTVDIDFRGIQKLNWMQIKQTLIPMLRRSELFNLDTSKDRVTEFLKDLLVPNAEEQEFLEQFKNKKYSPELLFGDTDLAERVSNHPMALWKIRA